MSTEDTNTPNAAGDERELPPGNEFDLMSELASVTAERDKLLNDVQDYKDRILRTQAEFENARRRAERERSEFIQYAGMEFVREILPIVDDFQRALQSGAALSGGPAKDYVKGMELIYQRLSDRLTKVGLEPVETTGKLFDPNLHQAVERVQTDEYEDQTILAEFQRGYFFKGRLLRPAMVKVAVHP